ncbi:MAG: radical SAM family heme chaperone HemW [Endomicrobiia bacterium]
MKKIALYIHIPFCKKKCNYCDFYSIEKKESLIDLYLQTLEKEIKNFDRNISVKTLYFGGGTPSILNKDQIKTLFLIIKNNFDLSTIEEITFEANPESFSEEKLELLQSFTQDIKKDVLRLSIGVQSFNDEILNSAGRIHTKKDVYKILEMLKRYKINNFNIDLIFGFNEQTLDDIKNDLYETIQFSPAHISCYALTVEENTLLFKNKYMPDFDLQAEMYDLIVEKLSENGYNRYEISNFSNPNFECKHNLNYWNYGEYLGFGCSAVSFIENKRIKNVSNVEEYIIGKYFYETEVLSMEQQIKERIMLGLRTVNGIKIDEEYISKYEKAIQQNLDRNYLILDKSQLKINDKYWCLSNEIISTFF